VVLAALLAGCSSVPTTGPVAHHTPQAASVDGGVRVDPLPPSEGASPLLIVEGFLHAMSTYQPDYAVARQYLTEDASKDWHPEDGVQIYADGVPLTDAGSSVRLVAQPVGQVDARGIYTAADEKSEPIRQDFALVKNGDGQWRISKPPAGLLLSRYLFSTGFTDVNLHFLDATGAVLVPDSRFFASGDQAIQAAIEAELAGPSEWLKPAVQPIDTAGVSLSSLDIDRTGQVKIVLGGTAATLNAAQRQRLLAEFAFTLASFSQVTGLTVMAGATSWLDPAGRAVVTSASYSQLSPDNSGSSGVLFAVEGADRKVRQVRNVNDASQTLEVVNGLTAPDSLTANAAATELAAVSADGKSMEVSRIGETKARQLRTGSGLLRPDYGRNGELWSAAAASVRQLKVYRADAEVAVDSSVVPDLPVVAIRLSPDGVRLALVLKVGKTTQVGLATVVRQGDDLRLGSWRPLSLTAAGATAGAASDIGWTNSTGLAVLITGDSGDSSVLKTTEDADTVTDLGPGDAGPLVQLAVAPGRSTLARSAEGSVYRYDGEFAWPLTMSSVHSLTYSG
jgi:Lipoprotein LpqB beta-propeller domain./Sporulation and spore germination.